jgi:hypothetical protein
VLARGHAQPAAPMTRECWSCPGTSDGPGPPGRSARAGSPRSSPRGGQHVDGPARPAHQGGLDEIVAEHMSAEGRLSRRSGSPQCAAKARVRMIALCPQ